VHLQNNLRTLQGSGLKVNLSNMEIKRNRFFTFLAMSYILFAFIWWTVLLFRKNEEANQAYIQSIRYELLKNGTYTTDEAMMQTPQYLAIKKLYDKHIRMILGEGTVLFLGLLLGIGIINRAFQKEISLTNQQRNFLLSITHELKSPIASISLVLDTLKKRKLDEKQQETLVSSAGKETERLHELVNNLLLSAKLDAEYTPTLEDIKIANLFDDLITKMKIRFPKATISINPTEVPSIKGDRQGLVSVFTNLVENAIKYADNQAVININYFYEYDNFHFKISDNGIGIPTEERKKIFEKFYRVGNEDTRQTKGTGLGLYIVNRIIKAHRGTIQVLDNTPNGSVFHVVLPE
jgi:signal transduction histidine kinase